MPGTDMPGSDTSSNGGAEKIHVVVIDDDAATCELLESAFQSVGIGVTTFTRAEEALRHIDGHPPNVVLTDLKMAQTSGLDVIERLRDSQPDIPVVVITGHADLDNAVQALRAGAYDFLTKPVGIRRSIRAVERAAERQHLRRTVRRLSDEMNRARPTSSPFQQMVGKSPPMLALYDLIERVAQTDVAVLISGESGTGKELVARALHDHGERAGGPFVAINCAAIPATLLESELFGHAKGAFTDASRARAGLFLEAQDGTLFLDEIGELPSELQPKLLRALQEREVRPVGDDQTVSVNARVITATNLVLEDEIEDGRFREDLFYRINVVRVELPPLRRRGNDVLLLAHKFLEEFASRYNKDVHGLTPEAAQALLEYPWPGNVRELENSIDRAVALTKFDRLTREDLPARVRERRERLTGSFEEDLDDLPTLKELEERYIRQVLVAVDDNKSHAARILGINRKTLHRRAKRNSETAELNASGSDESD